jgi:rhodanese-related sulfurtransferase
VKETMTANTIKLNDFRRLLESGRPLKVLDVRTPAEYRRVHVAGAESAPLDRLDPAGIAATRKDCSDPLYVICQTGGRAAKACQKLKEAGVEPVYSIEGGTAAWERMGLPVERGESAVISLERQVRIAAGTFILLGLGLAWILHPYFLAVPGIVGAGLVFAGVTDTCGMAIVLGRMPWNQRE